MPVATKDEGVIYISYQKAWGTQRHLIRQIITGRHNGIFQHYVHKSRAVGATVILHLWTLFCLFKYPGLQGSFIADDADNLEVFRDVIRQMAIVAPGSPVCEHDPPHEGGIRVSNKSQMVWENMSRLGFQYAGVRAKKTTKLGVGRGLSFAHATEAPIWLTTTIAAYLRKAFSKTHEAACYVFEGTARGRNQWMDILNDAKTGVSQQVIFLGWWLREDNRWPADSEPFRQYWDGRPTKQEKSWIREVARRYQHELTPEQLAWRRWSVKEEFSGDDRLADQEVPTLPQDAFEATGESFVPLEILRRCRRSIASAPAPTWYRYEFGGVIEETHLKKTLASRGELALWEEAKPAEAYVVAAVPAFSTNEDDPTYVASVFQATRDSLVQVAEFSDDECGMQPFAWVCYTLAAIYQSPGKAFILETLGIGQGVLDELRGLRGTGWGTRHRHDMGRMLGGLNHYIWRRPDSLTAAAALQWRTNPDNIAVAMNRLRDQLINGRVILRSEKCAAELERVRQDGNEFKPEGRDATSHHLTAAALAVVSWSRQLRPLFERVQGTSKATTVTGRMAENFFERLGAVGATR